MTIATSGWRSLILATATIPETLGIRTSMRTTSGEVASTRSSASLPSEAWPTTSWPQADKSDATPSRKRTWSSTSAILMASVWFRYSLRRRLDHLVQRQLRCPLRRTPIWVSLFAARGEADRLVVARRGAHVAQRQAVLDQRGAPESATGMRCDRMFTDRAAVGPRIQAIFSSHVQEPENLSGLGPGRRISPCAGNVDPGT